MSFRSKLDNFWYYHKWKVLIGGAVLFCVIYLSIAGMSDRKADFYAVVVTTDHLAEEDKYAVCEGLGKAAGDRNGDGEYWASCQFVVLADLVGGPVDQEAYIVLQTALVSRRYEAFIFSGDIAQSGRFDEYLTDHVAQGAGLSGKYVPIPDDAFSKLCARMDLQLTMRAMGEEQADEQEFFAVADAIAAYYTTEGKE